MDSIIQEDFSFETTKTTGGEFRIMIHVVFKWFHRIVIQDLTSRSIENAFSTVFRNFTN